MHVYVLEYIVSLSYRTAWWMFTKVGRDEVFMTLHLSLGVFFLQIPPRGGSRAGENRSMSGSFSKGLEG